MAFKTASNESLAIPGSERELHPEPHTSTYHPIKLQHCYSQHPRIRQLHPGSRCARTRAHRGTARSETFARTPLHERPWYEGLPADVKEYLAIVAQANQRPKESWQVGARKVRAGKVAVDNDRRDSDEQPVPVGQRQDVI